jgi:Flp pilus assembly protein TadB
MSPTIIIAAIALVFALGCIILIVVSLKFPKDGFTVAGVGFKVSRQDASTSSHGPLYHRRRKGKKKVTPFEELLFQAGFFDARSALSWSIYQKMLPLGLGSIGGLVLFLLSKDIVLTSGGAIIGALWGAQLPRSLITRRIAERHEGLSFHLPLVIEHVIIGISSSLDIGPCLGRVVTIADERGTHNPVSELLSIALSHVRSGLSLEEGLQDVGLRSGHAELNHTFIALGQVAKHGGEITKQLQELADSLSTQREARIEQKIKSLELKATGPVALTFVGFMIILLTTLFTQFKLAL